MANQTPLTLGVLVTYHDEPAYLRECLEAIAAQRRPVDEILVYDDASRCPADTVIPAGSPARLIRGPHNLGVSASRNILLQASGCDYVHFHDADDLLHPEWSQQVGQAIATSGADVVLTEYTLQSAAGLVQNPRNQNLRLWTAFGDPVQFCIRQPIVPAGSTLRRSRGLAVGGFREPFRRAEDWDFHIRVAASAPTFALIEEPLVTKRVRPEGLSADRRATCLSVLALVPQLARELPPRYRGDLADAAAAVSSTLYRVGARAEAARGFALARTLGPPRFRYERPLYRLLARWSGPLAAEWLGVTYRRVVPPRVKALVNRSGW